MGWINGWAIFLADVIVMASLAEIAFTHTFMLFGFSDLGGLDFSHDHRRGPVDRDHDL